MTILVTPVGGIHQTWNQQIEMGMAPLTIFTDDPPGEFVLPAPTTLGSVDLKYLVFALVSPPAVLHMHAHLLMKEATVI